MSEYQKIPIPPALRWEVWERDDFTCHYCGERKWLAIDHIQAESVGGVASLDNLVTCCTQCNSRKNARDYGEFRFDAQAQDQRTRIFWNELQYHAAMSRLEAQAAACDVLFAELEAECGYRFGTPFAEAS